MKLFRVWCNVTAALLAAGSVQASVVINEIMYHPPSHDPREEYIELFNNNGASVDLSGWSISGGIDFVFPPNTILPSGKYLVVYADRAAFGAKSPGVTNIIGDWLTSTIVNVNGRAFTNY